MRKINDVVFWIVVMTILVFFALPQNTVKAAPKWIEPEIHNPFCKFVVASNLATQAIATVTSNGFATFPIMQATAPGIVSSLGLKGVRYDAETQEYNLQDIEDQILSARGLSGKIVNQYGQADHAVIDLERNFGAQTCDDDNDPKSYPPTGGPDHTVFLTRYNSASITPWIVVIGSLVLIFVLGGTPFGKIVKSMLRLS